MATIVVGVDGSQGSEKALRWAADEARLRGARLRVVHAWLVPLMEAAPAPYLLVGPLPTSDHEEIAEAHRAHAQQVLEDVVGRALGADHGLDVQLDLVEGRPAEELVRAAEGADLVVVGSRGRGGFTGLLLGSVSQQTAQHAHCPVVIVPGT